MPRIACVIARVATIPVAPVYPLTLTTLTTLTACGYNAATATATEE